MANNMKIMKKKGTCDFYESCSIINCEGNKCFLWKQRTPRKNAMSVVEKSLKTATRLIITHVLGSNGTYHQNTVYFDRTK